jgi:phosphoserine phosphatase
MTPGHGRPRFGSVIFDCDSTLSAVEGIDELAGDRRAEIAALTEGAMRGEVPLEAVYARRLEAIRPTRHAIEALALRYIELAVDGAREVVATLRQAGVEVGIVSGGLRPALLPLAAWLGVTPERLAAVDLHFDERGDYAGFDVASPLARAGGKREVLAAWRPSLPPPVLLVGDGVTDLEARPAVDAFVAFMGVANRPTVRAAAELVITAPSLRPVLELVLPKRS